MFEFEFLNEIADSIREKIENTSIEEMKKAYYESKERDQWQNTEKFQ